MKFAYFICIGGSNGKGVRKRIGDYHKALYHGCGHYVGDSTHKIGDGKWQRPALSNSNRERLHVSRSGRFVPQVCCPISMDMVVSSAIKRQLSELPGIEFQPVVFERLVDLPLPPISDTSNETEERLYCITHMEEKIVSMPNIDAYHQNIGEFFSILMPQYYAVSDTVQDGRPLELQIGNYFTSESNNEEFSVALLERHAMYRVGRIFCLTERAFEVLAPWLDRDYFMIDVLSLMRKETFTQEEGISFPAQSD